jgi:hypothetical protein
MASRFAEAFGRRSSHSSQRKRLRIFACHHALKRERFSPLPLRQRGRRERLGIWAIEPQNDGIAP